MAKRSMRQKTIPVAYGCQGPQVMLREDEVSTPNEDTKAYGTGRDEKSNEKLVRGRSVRDSTVPMTDCSGQAPGPRA